MHFLLQSIPRRAGHNLLNGLGLRHSKHVVMNLAGVCITAIASSVTDLAAADGALQA